MTDEPDDWTALSGDILGGQATFQDVLELYSAALFVRQLASIDGSGHPRSPRDVTTAGAYVAGVKDRADRLERCLRDARSCLDQSRNPPPVSWLQEHRLSLFDWTQRQVDLGTVLLYSVADVGLLLVNATCRLGFDQTKCTARAVRGALRNEGVILEAVDDLIAATNSVTFPRHAIVHRAQKRDVERFTEVARVAQLLDAFTMPTRGVALDVEGGLTSAMDLLAHEIGEVEGAARRLYQALGSPFLIELTSLGGVPLPGRAEITRAREAVAYFEGGDRPAWMDE